MPTETSYAPQSPGGGPAFRVLQITTLIAGVPTVVDMEVIALADSAGNVIDNFMDYNWQRRVIDELAGIRQLMAQRDGVLVLPTNP